MLVGLKGRSRGATCLHWYSLHFNYKLKSFFFKQRKHLIVFLLCGPRSHRASFSSSATRMVIMLFKVSPRIFEIISS